MTKPIKMPSVGLDRVGPRNHVLDGVNGQGGTNLFAAMSGDKTTMQPFVKIL